MHHRAGIRSSRVAEYRCRQKGCVLLEVWPGPNGPEFYAPVRHTDGLHLMVNSGGRIGFSSRPPEEVGIPADCWAGRLSDHQPSDWVPVVCDHLRGGVVVGDILRAIAGREPGRYVRVLWPVADTRGDATSDTDG